jgi:hypothetical protein
VITCTNAATCEADCSGDCRVTCANVQQCNVRCAGGATPTTCGGGVVACGPCR